MRDQVETKSMGHSALPGILREIIRTPACRDLLRLYLQDINPEEAKEVVQVLIWEDPELMLSVVAASPQILNWLVEAVAALGEQVDILPNLALKEFAGQLAKDINIDRIKDIPAIYSPLLESLIRQDPETVNRLVTIMGLLMNFMGSISKKVYETADFGKLRVALISHWQSRMEDLQGEVEIENPIALINILGLSNPFINYLLRVLSRAFARINLPPEFLAYGLFKVMEDIDPKELGPLLNNLAAIVNSLHKGDLILGEGQPYFKEVLTRMGKALKANVDGEELKQAALALGADGKVIGSVISDYIFGTDGRTLAFTSALLTVVNAQIRTVAEISSKLSELPPEAISRMADGLERNLEAQELGRALNSLTVIFNRTSAENPDMASEILKEMLVAIELEQMGAALKTLLLQFKEAAFADPDLSAKLAPAAVGQTLNVGLDSFIRFSREKPALIANGLSQTLKAVDDAKLNQALNSLVSQLVDAALNNAAIVKALIKPIIKGSFKYLKGIIKNLRVFKWFKR